MIPGIDVSHYQGTIDWAKVKAAGTRFAYLKATQGASFVDPKLEENVYGCVSVGLPFGLYHVFLANTGCAQISNWTKARQKWQPDLPSWLDIEPGAVTEETAPQTLEMLDAGFVPEDCVYCSPATAQAFLFFSAFRNYGLAIAHYTEAKPNTVEWPDWVFWQQSPSWHVDGVITAVDRDYFNGDDAAFSALIQRANGLKAQPVSTAQESAKT